MNPNETTAYWWRGVPNFGDCLTPLLLRHFSELNASWAPARDADIVGVGSILEHIPLRPTRPTVLGAGRLFEHSDVNGLRGSKVLALRGPLSARGIPGNYALGDPGLLANELVRVKTKKHLLGIVPHWSDGSLASNPTFSRFKPHVIDPRGEPIEVIRQIGECHKIVSSSLHGIILADAFGIPRRFEYTQRFAAEGGTFKFRDYSAAIRTKFVVGETTEANHFAIDDRRHELYDVFRGLVS